MSNAIENQIRDLLTEHFAYGAASELPPDDESLSDAGIVDSAGTLTLILLLEENFQIEIVDSEVQPDNFDSVSKLATFVASKQKVTRR